MSTGLNCTFEETEPGKWYYVLEDYGAPKNAWDWRENATAYGPFGSLDDAIDHLGRMHANPGGYFVNRYSDRAKLSAVLRELIAKART